MVQITAMRAMMAGFLLAALPAEVAAFYKKNSPVIQLTAQNFKQRVLLSNYTTLVEFYAPWCGHCQNLKPTYEKVAENLKGIANVGAIDCDDDMNKKFCGEQGIQGFPHIKRFSPNAGADLKDGRTLPKIDDYTGDRSAASLRDFILETMPNHVTRIDSKKKFSEFLSKANHTAKVVLFTNKGVTSPLYKALAIDYHGVLRFAQIRDSQKYAAEEFGITNYPTLILLPGGDKEGLVYDGKMKKDDMIEFLKQVAEPNKGLRDFSRAKKDPKIKEAKREEPDERPIPSLDDAGKLEKACLGSDTKAVCIVAVTPPIVPKLTALELEHGTLYKAGTKTFWFYQIPRSILSDELRDALELGEDEELDPEKPGRVIVRAINGKRKWFKKFEGDLAVASSVRHWLDDLKMGDGKKYKLDLKKAEKEKEETKEEKKKEEEAKEEKKEDEKKEDETKEKKEEKPRAPVHEEL